MPNPCSIVTLMPGERAGGQGGLSVVMSGIKGCYGYEKGLLEGYC